MKWLYLVLILCLSLTACGKKLDGVYDSDAFSLEFKGGKVYQLNKMTSLEMEFDYKVDGNKLKLSTPSGNMVMTILENGSIEGMGGIYSKPTYMEGKYDSAKSPYLLDFKLDGTMSREYTGTDVAEKKKADEITFTYFVKGDKLIVNATNSNGQTKKNVKKFLIAEDGTLTDSSNKDKYEPYVKKTYIEGKYVNQQLKSMVVTFDLNGNVYEKSEMSRTMKVAPDILKQLVDYEKKDPGYKSGYFVKGNEIHWLYLDPKTGEPSELGNKKLTIEKDGSITCVEQEIKYEKDYSKTYIERGRYTLVKE